MPTLTSLPQHISGIYQIRCIPTDKLYIGSSVHLQRRWEKHRRALQRGNHHNVYLQSAWNKYGEQNFEFLVLELVDRSDLLHVEQKWIDKTGCTDRNIGFNIYTIAGSPGDTNVQIWEGFIDPEDNEVTITNLYDFCRQHNLDFPSMHRLAKGKSKLKSYKGWTHKNSPRRREYVKTYTGFINPDGVLIGPVTNLAAFCREHGLNNSHMVAVAKGRIYSNGGWTYDNYRENLSHLKTYTSFINPDGQQVVINDLITFCHEHGLDKVHMYEVMGGRRKSHKGWTWRQDKE